MSAEEGLESRQLVGKGAQSGVGGWQQGCAGEQPFGPGRPGGWPLPGTRFLV